MRNRIAHLPLKLSTPHPIPLFIAPPFGWQWTNSEPRVFGVEFIPPHLEQAKSVTGAEHKTITFSVVPQTCRVWIETPTCVRLLILEVRYFFHASILHMVADDRLERSTSVLSGLRS